MYHLLFILILFMGWTALFNDKISEKRVLINVHLLLGLDDETMRQELGCFAKGVVPAPKTVR